MEITQMLVLSTAHLTPEACNEWIPNSCPWAVYPKGEWGYFMYACDDAVDDATPTCVVNALILARTVGAQWIMFDCDGDVSEGLTVYDW